MEKEKTNISRMYISAKCLKTASSSPPQKKAKKTGCEKRELSWVTKKGREKKR